MRLTRRPPPRLSVVIPMYNTAPYLEECLESVLAQTCEGLELVLVDDGSSDDSYDLAVRLLQGRADGVVLQTPNRGLGAARNIGVHHATGEYLTFLDSDDTLPPDAYQLMLSTIEETGSDFVAGSVLQQTGEDVLVPGWIAAVHRQRRLHITVEDFPEVARDILATNKVFRRTFWDRAGLSFPQGLRYEDQVAITQAYCRASRIDVLRRPVYVWKLRTDSSSITQRRHELADLQDRVVTKLLVSQLVEEPGCETVRAVWRRFGLLGDLPNYLKQVPTCSDAYWSLLRSGLRQMLQPDTRVEESNLAVGQRLVAALVLAGMRAEAAALVTYLRDHPGELPTELVRGDGGEVVLARLPTTVAESAGQALGPELRMLQPRDARWRAQVAEARVDGSRLVVAGTAEVLGFVDGPPPVVGVSLRGQRTEERITGPLRPTSEGRFVVDLDLADRDLGAQVWRLTLAGTFGHLTLPVLPAKVSEGVLTGPLSAQVGDCAVRISVDDRGSIVVGPDPERGSRQPPARRRASSS
jgi:hypothetical protein